MELHAAEVSPAETIPDPDPKQAYFPIIYLFGNHLCDLSSGDMRLYFADFPKAIQFRLRISEIAADAQFYYGHEYRFARDWAFARLPEDNFFEPHAVWMREAGSAWVKYTDDAKLASPR